MDLRWKRHEWRRAAPHRNPTYPPDCLEPIYYEAYSMVFRLENALRVFAYLVLKSAFLDSWLDTNVSDVRESARSIVTATTPRIYHAQKLAYIGDVDTCPMCYLTLGEIVNAIVSERCWPHFKAYFPCSRDTLAMKFKEILNVRHSIAHFRPVLSTDVDIILSITQSVLMGVAEMLDAALSTPNFVAMPSNIKSRWYSVLGFIESPNIGLSWRTSRNGQWCRLLLRYNNVAFCLDADDIGENARDMVALSYVNISDLLKALPEVAKYTIAVSEEFGYDAWCNDGMPAAKAACQEIVLAYATRTLEDHYEAIGSAITEMLDILSRETQLLKQDPKARGQFIHDAVVTYDREDGLHEYFRQNGMVGRASDAMPEYWGDYLGMFNCESTTQFFEGATRYPWNRAWIGFDTLGRMPTVE